MSVWWYREWLLFYCKNVFFTGTETLEDIAEKKKVAVKDLDPEDAKRAKAIVVHGGQLKVCKQKHFQEEKGFCFFFTQKNKIRKKCWRSQLVEDMNEKPTSILSYWIQHYLKLTNRETVFKVWTGTLLLQKSNDDDCFYHPSRIERWHKKVLYVDMYRYINIFFLLTYVWPQSIAP